MFHRYNMRMYICPAYNGTHQPVGINKVMYVSHAYLDQHMCKGDQTRMLTQNRAHTSGAYMLIYLANISVAFDIYMYTIHRPTISNINHKTPRRIIY